MSPGTFRVLIVDMTSTFGGAFELALSLCKHINDLEGQEAHLVSSQPPEVLRSRVDGLVPYYHLPVRHWHPPHPGALRKRIEIAVELLRRELAPAARLAHYARRHGCSVIHLNNALNSQMYGVLAARIAGARCVCSYRGYGYPSRIVRTLGSMVDRYIACSKPIRDHLIEAACVPEEKIAFLYDPVDTEKFSPEGPQADLEALFRVPRGRRVIAIFGRLVPWKGHEVFLRAARLVLEAIPDTHAMIVGDVSDGDPAYGERLRQMAGELGIADRTTFTGFRADVPQLMRASEILVHASLEPEPFGTALLEGMACGRPYVAMDEGGPAEMITTGKQGLLVRPDAPEAMAGALVTLLTQTELAAAFGRAAREHCVERFSAPVIAREHVELYHEVAEGR